MVDSRESSAGKKDIFGGIRSLSGASLLVQMVKNLPAIWETQVRSLGREDLLEKETATCFSILA